MILPDDPYLIVGVLVFAITLWLGEVASRRNARGSRLLWGTLLAILGMTWVGGRWMSTEAVEREKEVVRNQLHAMAATYLVELETMGHAKIGFDTPADDPLYLELIEAEKRWLAANPQVADIYTMRMRDDGKLAFLVDSETDYDGNGRYEGAREMRVPIGEVYEEWESDEALQSAISGIAAFSDEVVSDRWGEWVGAFYPIRSPDGGVDGYLGIDYPADQFLRAANREGWSVLIVVVALSAIFIGLCLYCEYYRLLLMSTRDDRDSIRATRDRFRELFECAPEAIVLVSDGVIETANPQAEQLLGRASGTAGIAGARIASLVAKGDRARLDQLLANVGAGRVADKPLTVRAEGLGAGPVLEIVAEKMEGNGGHDNTLLLLRDVTERDAARIALRETHQMLEIHIRNSPLALIEVDHDCRVQKWSPRAEEIFGWRAEEMVGNVMAHRKFVHEDDEHRVGQEWEALSSGDRPRSTCRNKNYRKGGEVIECEWFNSAYYDEDGRLVSVFALVRDRTGEALLETQLREVQKLRGTGQLAAGVACEFAAALTAIHGHVVVLEAGGGGENQALSEIKMTSKRAEILVRQLMAFGRERPMRKVLRDLRVVVEGFLNLLRHSLPETIQVTVETDPGPLLADVDEAMFEQVLIDLCMNAKDAMAGRGTLKLRILRVGSGSTRWFELPENVRAPAEGDFACLEVEDDGVGMNPETLDRVFEPLFSTKAVGQAAGVGLPSVRAVARHHRGAVDADSAPGEGSVFRFYLPLAPSVATDFAGAVAGKARPKRLGPARARAEEGVAGETILVVDDEPAVRLLAATSLQILGYRIISAVDGVEALQIWEARCGEIDAVVTDLVMPNGVSGIELGNRLRAACADLPIVYTSGYSREVGDGSFARRPATRFLEKPYTPDQLAGAVRDVLAERGAVVLAS
ncbi:hypothetical protein BH23VER1_BH23VER1_00250 [soil metagenome]